MPLPMDKILLGLRATQGVLSVIVLGLMAYVASWWTSHWRVLAPAEVNFLIFSPVWSLLALAALIVVPMKMATLAGSAAGKYGLLALEAVTMLFWFGGFVALAVFLRDRICFGAVCDTARAGTAIAAINWLAWVGSVGVGAMGVLRGKEEVAPMLKEPKPDMQGV